MKNCKEVCNKGSNTMECALIVSDNPILLTDWMLDQHPIQSRRDLILWFFPHKKTAIFRTGSWIHKYFFSADGKHVRNRIKHTYYQQHLVTRNQTSWQWTSEHRGIAVGHQPLSMVIKNGGRAFFSRWSISYNNFNKVAWFP